MSNFIEHLWISRLSQNRHKDKEGTVPVVTGFTRGQTIKQTGLILSAEKCDQTLQKDCVCLEQESQAWLLRGADSQSGF